MASSNSSSTNPGLTTFKKYEKLGEGTYAAVYKAKHVATKAIGALKVFRTRDDEVSFDSIVVREIAIMKALSHPNVMDLISVDECKEKVRLFMPLADGSIKNLINNDDKILDDPIASKVVMYQIVKGMAYLTAHNVMHRDLKPDNILYQNVVDSKIPWVRISDFGLSRANCTFLKAMTHEVATIWYRCPEILLGIKRYDEKMDVWSVGCILAEIYTKRPLFPGDSEIDQLFKIFRCFGTPTEETWPGLRDLPFWKDSFPNWKEDKFVDAMDTGKGRIDPVFEELLRGTLTLDPKRRLSIFHIQNHRFFDDVRALVDVVPLGEVGSPYVVAPVKELSPISQADVFDGKYPQMRVQVEEKAYFNEKNRLILFDWLIEVAKQYHLNHHSFFLTTLLMDTCASLVDIKRDDIQLYGVACMKIAADFHEVYSPALDEFVYLCDNTYTKERIAEVMTKILLTLEFKVIKTVPVDYIRAINSFYSPKVIQLAEVLIVSSLASDACFRYSTKTIALACVNMACLHLGEEFVGEEKKDEEPWIIAERKHRGSNRREQQAKREKRDEKEKVVSEIKSCALDIAHAIEGLKEDSQFLHGLTPKVSCKEIAAKILKTHTES